jgi:AcrR family transcriptional regulator
VGRPPAITDDDVLDAALKMIGEGGDASAAGIARALGVPSGSIYHRFASRDHILAGLWLRTTRRFQDGFIHSLDALDAAQGARRAALHALAWARTSPPEATLLWLYRRDDLVSAWPDDLAGSAARVGSELAVALRKASDRLGFSGAGLDRVRFSLIDIPQAAVRRALVHGDVPWSTLEALVAESLDALLGPGAGAKPVDRMSA